MTVAAILGCASPTNKRRKNDFYETQAAHTRALLRAIHVPNPVWEPCTGNGAIAGVLHETKRRVIEGDIVARRRGVEPIDFFAVRSPRAWAIVTNPPYKHAARFIRYAHELEIRFLALLLKADFMNTLQRFNLANDIGMPTHVFGLIKRPDFTGEGSPPMVCSWYVWEQWGATSSTFTLVDNRK